MANTAVATGSIQPQKNRSVTRRTPLGIFSLKATSSPRERLDVLRRALGPAIMSNEQQANVPPDQQISPHDPQNSSIGNSVVHDLMRVYESLTQSSTPQIKTDENEKNPCYGTEPNSGHPYPLPHAPQQQPAMPASYNMPPPNYNFPGHNQYPPTQQPQEQGVPQPPYFADAAYSQQPYMVPPPDHQPQHGYSVLGHGQSEHQQHPPLEQEEDDFEAEEGQESAGRSKRKRGGSDNSGSSGGRGQKGRKKNKASDGRWSKRFTWPEDLHRDFVSAIFDVGLKHSSPTTILEHMPKHEQITTERIKSHLQKYRLHRVKSKKEFVSSYETSLRNLQNRDMNGDSIMHSGGEVAAQLTCTSLGKGGSNNSDKGPDAPKSAEEPPKDIASGISMAQCPNTEALMLPQLTEAEKASPIGAAMGYLMGLFFSLKQQLMVQRAIEAAEEKKKGNAPVQDVFNSFVAGSAPAEAPALGDVVGDPSAQSFDGAAMKPAVQSVRTNIEENSMMKREMQNQMALQNKMRALKQQELNKYKNPSAQVVQEKTTWGQTPAAAPTEEEKSGEAIISRMQGAGEIAGHDGAGGNRHQRGLSIGASDEFWNTDVVDEQLFEFLMNN